MLGPFRIRGVSHPRRRGSPTASTNRKIVEAVVSIDGDRYEELIRKVPSAKLHYLDSDLDPITIGSQQELADRLAEPILRFPAPQSFALRALPYPSPDMHTFTFNSSSQAVDEWKQIQDEQSARAHPVTVDEVEDVATQEPQPPERPPKIPESPQPPKGGKAAQVLDPAPVHHYEARQLDHFRNSNPPSISAVQGESSGSTVPQAHPSELVRPSFGGQGVLTAQGLKEAREQGAMLRARLYGLSHVPNFYASSTSRPDNRWATYSSPVRLDGQGASANSPVEHEPTSPAAPAVDPQPVIPAESPATAGQDESPRVTSAAETDPAPPAPNSEEQKTGDGHSYLRTTNVPTVDLREPLEVMVSKMVAQSVESISSELGSLAAQLQLLVLPKVPDEAFKLRGYPDPEQLKEMWRDLEETKRAMNDFVPEIHSAATLFSDTNGEAMFPTGTGMINIRAMRSSSAALKDMAAAVDKLVGNVLQGAVPVEDSEASKKFPGAEYVIPKRLTACDYEDMWCITLGNLEGNATKELVSYIIWRARNSLGLPAIELGAIDIVNLASGCQAEIEISGKQRAGQTFYALTTAESDHMQAQVLNLKRKLYPKKYTPSSKIETAAPPARESGSPTGRVSQDPPVDAATQEAKFKAIQERRAAWRRVHTARQSGVRFKDPVVEPKVPVEPSQGNTLLDSPVPSMQTAPSLQPSVTSGNKRGGAAHSQTETNQPPRVGAFNLLSAAAAQVESSQQTLRPAKSMRAMKVDPYFAQELKRRRSLPAIRNGRNSAADAGAQARGFRWSQRPNDQPQRVDLARHFREAQTDSNLETVGSPPGAWPEDSPVSESSGAFSRRMMGRNPAASHLISPHTSPPLRPAETRPVGFFPRPRPVSAIDFLAGPSASQPASADQGLHRRVTFAGPSSFADPSTKSAGGPWSRRPYSATYDGSGRSSRSSETAAVAAASMPPQELRPALRQPTQQVQELADDQAAEQEPQLRGGSWGMTVEEVRRFSACVDSLVEMGFAQRDDTVRMGRMWLYARVAGGELDGAIDLIVEEREAWEQRGVAAARDI